MKRTKALGRLACLICLCYGATIAAQETAVVKDGRINVRGQASLTGEIITQLQKGDKVVILEEITVAKPKTNEPPKWARIQMPPKTPVWVYAPFLDLANKTVKATRLNLRAGPGENYSVVGRLERGAPVTEIRRVEDWLEIETPPGAYAFVAADLLAKTAGPATEPKLDTAAPSVASPQPVASTQAEESRPAPTPEQTAPPATPIVREPPTTTVKSEEKVTPTETAPTVAAPTTIPAAAQPETQAPAAVKTKSEEAPPRRVVRREGLVRSTASIQAPTYYELLSPENRKTINYLHTEKLGLDLKDYRGRRIIVTGEEGIDPRWPKTPVIEVDTLELIP